MIDLEVPGAVRRSGLPWHLNLGLCLFGGVAIALSGIACGDDDPAEPTPDPTPAAFPADYETTYTMVRDCRPTLDHGLGSSVQVWTDPGSAETYLDGEAFEVGAVLLKPIFIGDECEGGLTGYVVMIKGPAGTDPDHNDWIWQETDANRNVTSHGLLQSCTGCHAACSDRDYACTDE